MPNLYADRVRETTTTTGTGTISLAGAPTGFRTFVGAIGGGETCCYEISDGTDWEIGIGTITDASPDTLSRDVILANSAGTTSAINFSAGTKQVACVLPSAVIRGINNHHCQGRLTTESSVPVSTSDRSSQSTLYFTQYGGNAVSLWNGYGWTTHHLTEISLALSGLTASRPYDIWIYHNGSTLALDKTAWTNDTTRATALAYQDGVPTKNGERTKRYVGTIYTTGTTTTEDSAAKRFVWNANHRVHRTVYKLENSTYTYGTNSIRQMNAGSANQIEVVNGLQADAINLGLIAPIEIDETEHLTVGIGENSTSAFHANATPGQVRDFSSSVDDGKRLTGLSMLQVIPRLGYSAYTMLERADSGTGQFIGQIRLNGIWQC